MKKLSIVIFLILLQYLAAAQTMPNRAYINQSKYWFYRNRLINEFCKVGPNQGESIPFQSINYKEDFAGTPNGVYGQTGDGGVQKLGHYIAVLASEIKLLKMSNQNRDKTIEELFYALYAAKRLDETAETFNFCYDATNLNFHSDVLNDYNSYTNCSGGSPNWNGFMLRDDKNPKAGSPILKHFNNMTGMTNLTCGFGLNIAPFAVETLGPTTPWASTFNDVSHDQLGNLLLGLRLVQALLDGTENYTFSGTTYNIKTFSTQIATKIMDYMGNGSALDYNNCQYLKNFIGLNGSLNKWFSHILQPTGTALACTPGASFVTPTGNIPWLFKNTVTNQAASIENPVGASFPYLMSPGYADLGKILTGKNYVATPIAITIWKQLATSPMIGIYQLNDNWKILSLIAMTKTWSNLPCGWQPQPCFLYPCLIPKPFSTKCWVQSKLPVPAICPAFVSCVNQQSILNDQAIKAHYEILPLVYNVINNTTGFNSNIPNTTASTAAYTNFFQTHIDNAPCRGPYCYNNDPSKGAIDKAGNDWASWSLIFTAEKGNTHRWDGEKDSNFYKDMGEFNGLDYMLMYNLYNIYNNKTDYYVNYDNNLSLTNRTITTPEYYNARGFKDYIDIPTGHNGAYINGKMTVSNVTVNTGAYLDLRAGASITLSPPFTANGTMHASIYTPALNRDWEMTICSNGIIPNGTTPTGNRVTNGNGQNYFSMEEYTAAQAQETPPVITTNILEDAYPNPATNTTSIPYTISNEESVDLFIVDASGNKISSLVKKDAHPVGDFTVDYNTSLLTPGVYYYTLKTPSYSKTKKLVIIK